MSDFNNTEYSNQIDIAEDSPILIRDSLQQSRESSEASSTFKSPRAKKSKMVQSSSSPCCDDTNEAYLEQLAIMRSRVSSLDISESRTKSAKPRVQSVDKANTKLDFTKSRMECVEISNAVKSRVQSLDKLNNEFDSIKSRMDCGEGLMKSKNNSVGKSSAEMDSSKPKVNSVGPSTANINSMESNIAILDFSKVKLNFIKPRIIPLDAQLNPIKSKTNSVSEMKSMKSRLSSDGDGRSLEKNIIFVKPAECKENSSSSAEGEAIYSSGDEFNPNLEITPRMFEVPPKKVCVRLKTPNINPREDLNAKFKFHTLNINANIGDQNLPQISNINVHKFGAQNSKCKPHTSNMNPDIGVRSLQFIPQTSNIDLKFGARNSKFKPQTTNINFDPGDQNSSLRSLVETIKTVSSSEHKATNTEGRWVRVSSGDIPNSVKVETDIDPRVIIHKSSNLTSSRTSVEDEYDGGETVSNVTSIESPELQVSPCSDKSNTDFYASSFYYNTLNSTGFPKDDSKRIKELLENSVDGNRLSEEFAYCVCKGKELAGKGGAQNLFRNDDCLKNAITRETITLNSVRENEERVTTQDNSFRNKEIIQNKGIAESMRELYKMNKNERSFNTSTDKNEIVGDTLTEKKSLDEIEVFEDSLNKKDSLDKIELAEDSPDEIKCNHDLTAQNRLIQYNSDLLKFFGDSKPSSSDIKKPLRKNKVAPIEPRFEENFSQPLKNLGENTNTLIKDVVSNLAVHFFKFQDEICTRDELDLQEEAEASAFQKLAEEVGNSSKDITDNEKKAELLRRILNENIEHFRKNGVQINRRPQVTSYRYYHVVRAVDDEEIGAGENILRRDSLEDLDAIERVDEGGELAGNDDDEIEEPAGCCTLRACAEFLFTKKTPRFY